MRRSKKRKLRAEAAATVERKERQKERAFVAAKTKKVRKRTSVAGRLKMHDALLAASIMEMRNVSAEYQQQRDVTEILLSVCAKAALGRELDEDDRAVLEDFLTKEDNPNPHLGSELDTEHMAATGEIREPDAGPSPDVQPGS